MPYIVQARRPQLTSEFVVPQNAGELNFVITKLCLAYMDRIGGKSYPNLNEVVGVLECAKLEFYRRAAAPYEDVKIEQHGDVYL